VGRENKPERSATYPIDRSTALPLAIAAFENGSALGEHAAILAERGHWYSAVGLLIMGQEELAKSLYCYLCAMGAIQPPPAVAARSLRQHTTKQWLARVPALIEDLVGFEAAVARALEPLLLMECPITIESLEPGQMPGFKARLSEVMKTVLLRMDAVSPTLVGAVSSVMEVSHRQTVEAREVESLRLRCFYAGLDPEDGSVHSPASIGADVHARELVAFQRIRDHASHLHRLVRTTEVADFLFESFAAIQPAFRSGEAVARTRYGEPSPLPISDE